MKVVNEYPDGLFCWVDLTSTDVPAAKAFYEGLMGWEGVDTKTDMGTYYTMFKMDGHNVAGLGPMMPDMAAQGVPSHWSSYVKHSDVDAVAQKAAAAGGELLFPPMDVMEEGRMAMIQDPTGAMVGIWQPINHTGAQVVNHPHALVWNELQTNDTEKAKAFYEEVFGWATQTDDSDYTVCLNNGRLQAGMMPIDPNWGAVPPNWQAYFMSEDINADAEKVKELGGTILNGPMEIGEMGKIIVVQDPAGAVFTMMQFNGPVDAPPGHEE